MVYAWIPWTGNQGFTLNSRSIPPIRKKDRTNLESLEVAFFQGLKKGYDHLSQISLISEPRIFYPYFGVKFFLMNFHDVFTQKIVIYVNIRLKRYLKVRKSHFKISNNLNFLPSERTAVKVLSYGQAQTS